MDLHDYEDVAENYDHYLSQVTGGGGDIEGFHLDLAAKHGHEGVLDIACGTGATLIPLVQAGYRVTGIDISAPMLAVLEKKLATKSMAVQAQTELVTANMTAFDLHSQYSLAFIARSGFMHLLSPVEQEAALRNIHRHLTDNGILSFNTFDPNYAMIGANLAGTEPEAFLRGTYVNHRGNEERIWNQIEYDPLTQIMAGRWTFEEFDKMGNVIDRRDRPLQMRWSFEPEIRHLLRLCGFEATANYGSYDKEPRTYGGGIVWVARKR